ncbi:hypothetical protein ACH5RR_039927 [Cinchona calisaya]|uniref:PGG domain-containing protein n=1 Tax=Cinchona calisaya TaxID=153742 RepID=A0ABD2XZQ8_9GENT
MQLMTLLADDKEEELQTNNTTKLLQAAMYGTLPLISQILQEDPSILLTSSSSMLETPLHISSLLGRLEITKGLLTKNPELAKSPNSQGSTPLHLAAAKGYLEIVKELVLVNPDMCFVLDHDGRSPLHLAAIKGRVEILTELIRVKPEAARVLTGRVESCLHLCVNYNRFEGLKVLVERLKKVNENEKFVNLKDQNGNTILHLAVAKKQIEIIKYLLSKTEIDVHARNINGFTALDVLLQSQEDLRNMDIRQCLELGRSSNVIQTPSVVPVTDVARTTTSTGRLQNSRNISTKKQCTQRKQTDWLAKMRSALMVVASLVATVAFQAGLSPPGGVWSTDYVVDSNGNRVEKPHYAGQSVMAINLPEAYGQFLIFNTISFLASLSVILIQVSGLPLRKHRWMWTQLVIMWIAITAQSITYFISFVNLSPGRLKGTFNHVTRISVIIWLSLMGVVFIGNVVRAVLYVLRKKGYVKEKEREPTIFAEVEENDEL